MIVQKMEMEMEMEIQKFIIDEMPLAMGIEP
jgi:hypothetical protein